MIAKVANIVLATPASEAICERLFKRAKHIGTTDRMARPLDETFKMLIVAQYNIVRHEGVEAIDVRKRFIRIAHTVPESLTLSQLAHTVPD